MGVESGVAPQHWKLKRSALGSGGDVLEKHRSEGLARTRSADSAAAELELPRVGQVTRS